MPTIYKYPLVIAEHQVIPMPRGARILTALLQYGSICLWAEVQTDARIEPREIWIVGTGHPLTTEPLTYINSVIDGAFVWHVFDRAYTERAQ